MSSGERGYFLVERGWMDSPEFRRQHYTEREAWLWLLEHAAYSERNFRIGDYVVSLERGQLAASLRYLAAEWKWTKDRVSRFLSRLETATRIGTHTATGYTLITVCNYDEIQNPEFYGATSGETASATAPRQHRDKTEEKRKESKKGSKIFGDQFEEWWALVPHKVGKGTARKAFRTALKKAKFEDLSEGMKRYALGVNGTEPQFIKHPASWLNGERWLDEPVEKRSPITPERAKQIEAEVEAKIEAERGCQAHAG